jgi:diaminopimelate decarboxylase
MASLPVDFVGFHIFSGAQNLRPDAICESQQKAFALALELSRHAPGDPEFINIGGGFGIPYFPGDEPLALDSVFANLDELSTRLQQHMPGSELVLELGRFLVGEAGVYVCTVTDKKTSRGQVFLVTDGGLHHHLAASGNFGQVLRKNYPVIVANRVGSTDREVASVVGPLCTPLDLLADRMDLARAEIGDLIAIFQSGAYGYTASPHLFLGHPPPVELLL